MLNPFLDNRPIPNIKVNFRVKIKTKDIVESNNWNSFFAYIMGKHKTKIEFITTSILRNMPIYKVTASSLKPILPEKDYEKLMTVQPLFDEVIPTDLKAFILSILQVPVDFVEKITK